MLPYCQSHEVDILFAYRKLGSRLYVCNAYSLLLVEEQPSSYFGFSFFILLPCSCLVIAVTVIAGQIG